MNLISFHLLEKFQRNYCFSNSKRCPKKLNIWFNETNSVLNNFPYGFRYKKHAFAQHYIFQNLLVEGVVLQVKQYVARKTGF